jgi:hypothetical protein
LKSVKGVLRVDSDLILKKSQEKVIFRGKF